MNNPSDFAQLKRLSIFATVVDKGSFAQAGRALNLSRPAVSEQIALLEQQLGTRLLHRSTRKLSLTLDGEHLYPHAVRINTAFTGATQALQHEQLRGRVRITATVDFAIQWLAPKLQNFKQRYPDIDVDIISADTPLDLIDEQIDLALRIGIPNDAHFIARPLFKDSLRIYAHPNYLDAHGTPATPSEAEQKHWVLLTQIHANHRINLWQGEQQTTLHPDRVWHCNSPAVLMAQIEAGLGLGMAFPLMMNTIIERAQAIAVLPNWRSEEFTFSLVYSSRRHMSARVQALRDFLLGE